MRVSLLPSGAYFHAWRGDGAIRLLRALAPHAIREYAIRSDPALGAGRSGSPRFDDRCLIRHNFRCMAAQYDEIAERGGRQTQDPLGVSGPACMEVPRVKKRLVFGLNTSAMRAGCEP